MAVEDPTGIAALTKILPSDLGADEGIGWSAAEARWGTRFPHDYMAFMSIYGAGSFAEVGILMPLPKEYIQWDPGTFEEETENARYTWEMLGGQEGLDIDPNHILAWGITSSRHPVLADHRPRPRPVARPGLRPTHPRGLQITDCGRGRKHPLNPAARSIAGLRHRADDHIALQLPSGLPRHPPISERVPPCTAGTRSRWKGSSTATRWCRSHGRIGGSSSTGARPRRSRTGRSRLGRRDRLRPSL